LTTLFKILIAPLTQGIRREVANLIDPGARVLDIACGTGALAFELAQKAEQVIGIDLDERKIRDASKTADKLLLKNVQFLSADATHLKSLFPVPFDYSILSLALHQFPEPLRKHILEQARQISRKLILADYTVPRPKSVAGYLSLAIEKLAGGEHYAAYKTYLKAGGLPGILKDLDLAADQAITISSGVFTVIECQGQWTQKA